MLKEEKTKQNKSSVPGVGGGNFTHERLLIGRRILLSGLWIRCRVLSTSCIPPRGCVRWASHK